MKIRKATKKDLKKISEIMSVEYKKKPYNEKWSKTTSFQKIKDYFKKSYILVIEEKKRVVGFIIATTFLWYDGKKALIEEIIIDSKHQNKGLGLRLIEFAETFLKKKGVFKIELFANKKSKAFQFYKKRGFKISTKAYYYMWKEL